MKHSYRIRRTVMTVAVFLGFSAVLLLHPDLQQDQHSVGVSEVSGEVAEQLDRLEIKGRAPKTNYSRAQFGDGWATSGGCDVRNQILARDLANSILNDKCQVMSGTLDDPFTGNTIQFTRGGETSDDVQIDHVVALSDAWQKGAQQLSQNERETFANDPLELMAVEGGANQEKSDGDAATWLPPNKSFRCQYVSRQVAIKTKYRLWVTQAEKDAIKRVLATCPGQAIPNK